MGYISTVTTPDGNVHDIKSKKTVAIPFGTCDSTSTSTVFTATVDGITELYDGVCAYIRNNVVTSASGWTLNVNGLGAKPVYNTMENATAITTTFNVKYTMLFIYNSTRVANGCWDMYYGYFTNTTVGYGYFDYYFRPYVGQTVYRYKYVMQGEDNRLYPITTTNQEDSTQVAKVPTTVGLRPGRLWYYTDTTTVSAGNAITAGKLQAAVHTNTAVYNFNTDISTYRMVYLKGTYNKDKDLFYLYNNGSSPCTSYYTQVPMNTANITLSNYFTSGYYYLLLGGSYSTKNYLTHFGTNPLYYFDGTNLIPVETKIAKDVADSVPKSVKGTQTSTTASWTGAIDVPSLYDGLTIMYYLPRTSAANVTLNLTLSSGSTTGAIPVYYTGDTRMDTQYAAGSTITLTYWSASSTSINGTTVTSARWTSDGNGLHVTYSDNNAGGVTALIGVGDSIDGSKGFVTPQDYGAVGDGTTDDTTAIQNAINSGKDVYIPSGTYKITSTININLKTNFYLDASGSVVNYTGNGYAFLIQRVQFSNLKFGEVNAPNGGCIKIFTARLDNQGESQYDYVHYTQIYFNQLSAYSDCIFMNATERGWLNEIRFHGGKLASGENGVRYVHNSANGTSHNSFYDIGIEGVTKGFNFIVDSVAEAAGKYFTDFEFYNLRTGEASNIFTTVGKCTRFLIVGGYTVDANKTNLSATSDKWLVVTPDQLQIVTNGNINTVDQLEFARYITYTEFASNDDVNDYTIPGRYTCRTSAIAQTLSHCPVTTAFNMEVSAIGNVYQDSEKYRYIMQELYPISTNSTFYRRFLSTNNYGSTWTVNSWYQFAGTQVT